ncbi:response regulator receiver domain protein [Brevibacterium mcbrellneri ATCC 49030]|uniref:Response regulator receiver domain protein n=1 Tax=Brevibacterium mcbrellneri ATCC 49030 TaxID=585530 RepID=D4YL68_9MICO|nr:MULTISPECIES: response regulator transcription factor [Brevibacterium]EFG48162.1 response regulator receiver domain protein [Brevibacterium mcbrellneri ATCC 49030]MDK8346025.1 response regulator transcription factor [Brevibacterium sp. UMB1308B]MDK8713028.1 response regulator transcription factor [Brevibacterium sp. UMB1308A]
MSEEDTRPLVLVADDEPDVLGAVVPFLNRSGFRVISASDGKLALDEIRRHNPDACVLDVLMPGADGREVLRTLRREENWVPVVLLTQVGEAVERAMALEEGADDYINKPFDPHELVARVRAVLRRTRAGEPPLATASILTSTFGLKIDRVGRRAWLRDRELVITPKGFTLLEYLMVHKDELIERSRLLEVLWGFDDAVGTRAVDSRVAELRRVLGEDATEPRWIATVQGRGYKFVADVTGSHE